MFRHSDSACDAVGCAKAGHSFVIKHSYFVIHSAFHSLANRAAALLMKLLFGSVARLYVLRRGNSDRAGGFLLASNHISHFDPFIISSVVRRKIDWMAMAEFFPLPLLGFLLRAVDAFPAERDRADRKTIRTAIERLKHGRIVGLFPEGGIRNGARSVLEGAALRPGASTLAHIAGIPIFPCVIVGSDRLYSKKTLAAAAAHAHLDRLRRSHSLFPKSGEIRGAQTHRTRTRRRVQTSLRRTT
jgi:1-acyl-sn-glycerol-3-phosphate acyltransferase